MTLTEREMLIAKIGTLGGAVVSGMITGQKAFSRLKKIAERHGFRFNDAIILQNEIDEMLKDSTLCSIEN